MRGGRCCGRRPPPRCSTAAPSAAPSPPAPPPSRRREGVASAASVAAGAVTRIALAGYGGGGRLLKQTVGPDGVGGVARGGRRGQGDARGGGGHWAAPRAVLPRLVQDGLPVRAALRPRQGPRLGPRPPAAHTPPPAAAGAGLAAGVPGGGEARVRQADGVVWPPGHGPGPGRRRDHRGHRRHGRRPGPVPAALGRGAGVRRGGEAAHAGGAARCPTATCAGRPSATASPWPARRPCSPRRAGGTPPPSPRSTARSPPPRASSTCSTARRVPSRCAPARRRRRAA